MDFALSEEQTAIFDMARDFGASHIAPFAREWEAAGEIPKSLWPQLAELGFGGSYQYRLGWLRFYKYGHGYNCALAIGHQLGF